MTNITNLEEYRTTKIAHELKDQLARLEELWDSRQPPAVPISPEVLGRIFTPRGIKLEVANGAFFPYRQGDQADLITAYAHCNSAPSDSAWLRAQRAGGVLMKRFPVPEAVQDITPEMRPDRPILTTPATRRFVVPHAHDWLRRSERVAHVKRSKDTSTKVAEGCLPDELADIKSWLRDWEWNVNQGADHFETDTNAFHVHVRIAKYLFAASDFEKAGVAPHIHLDTYGEEDVPDGDAFETTMFGSHMNVHTEAVTGRELAMLVACFGLEEGKWKTDNSGWKRLLRQRHVRPTGKPSFPVYELITLPPWDEFHDHWAEVKSKDEVAKRLSWHPYRREERWQQGLVGFALEGCMKEAALVSEGMATFSCPSVTLWNCQEFEPFARAHLADKTVLVICDSDWDDGDHEQVTVQTLMARDKLRSFGVEAYACAPPETDCAEHDGKHGVDDFIGHGGKVGDLVVWDLTQVRDLGDHLADNPPPATPRSDGLARDSLGLRYLVQHAGSNGQSSISLTGAGKTMQHEFGSATPDAAGRAFRRAVDNLVGYGAVDKTDDLSDRGLWRRNPKWTKYGMGVEWVGKVTIREDLRARIDRTPVREMFPELLKEEK